MAFAMQANAQPRPDSVSVHAGQEPLRFLLTDEQKETIKYLTVTGTLLDEDYEYIREELITKLKELNLKEADIDTIPAYGFKCDKSSTLDNLLLPKGIKHVSDGAFFEQHIRNFIITGNFPTLGNNVFREEPYNNYMPQISEDNPCLKKTYDGSIYSLDGSVLYYYIYGDGNAIEYSNEKLKTIAPCALEGKKVLGLLIPETVDSIGDRAFAYVTKTWYTRSSYYEDQSVNCRALVPPRLGKDVFLNSELTTCTMYVPEECLELYKAADGWKDLHLEGKVFVTAGIDNTTDNCFHISDAGTTYQITSEKEIKGIHIYDVKGRLADRITVKAKETSIGKATLPKPYAIAKVSLENGTTKTVKLMPRKDKRTSVL